jgi:aryl-alcohol dehydrogenase-like predicted oxidoreductase
MHKRELGRTGLQVSAMALGTMTWGKQNTPEQGFAQMDYALEQGVNFFDTAELYAIPPTEETYGRTEKIIGSWFRKRGKREQVVLASKVCGPTAWCPHIRQGKARLDARNIITACEGSLKRLQTDRIDLYQTHWPDRNTNFFGRRAYRHADEEQFTPPEETLRALEHLIAQGKVRYIGVSNETPWGVMRHLHAAESLGLPRIASIQNPYSLLNRSFEAGLAEIACREDVRLLTYSPLAFGVLSGKYLMGQRPEGSRLALFPAYTRYSNPEAEAATAAYVQLARKHGLVPAQMALAFILQQPFVTSCIVGATRMSQLKENLEAAELSLSEEVIADIETIQQRHPNPCP